MEREGALVSYLALHLHGTQRSVARHSVVLVHVWLAAPGAPAHRHTLLPLPLLAVPGNKKKWKERKTP